MTQEESNTFFSKRKQLIEKLRVNEFDLSALLLKYEKISLEFKNKHVTEILSKNDSLYPRTEHVSSDIDDLVFAIRHALLAPSYHYNHYLKALINEHSFEELNEPVLSEDLLFSIYQIEVDSILLSFKTGLDRMVSLFTYYYKGIAPEGITFGHYNQNTNKFENFMARVNQDKEKDDLLKYVYDQYFLWIKKVVAPRDTIIHYNSLGIHKEYDHEFQAALPIHYNERYFKLLEIDENSEYRFNHESLKTYINQWISFTETIFSHLLNKTVIPNPKRIQYPDSQLDFNL